MLVISIEPQTYATIGNDVKVWNFGVSNARIGIEAPRELRILRQEHVERDAAREQAEEPK